MLTGTQLLSVLTPQILFESSEFAIVFKPYNFLSVRSRFHSQNAEENVFDFFAGNAKTFLPVHRLDREVAGLLLVAKSTEAQRWASAWFENRHLKKTYAALSLATNLNSLSTKLPFAIEELEPEKNKAYLWTSKILRGKKRSYSHKDGQISQTQATLLHSENIGQQRVNLWKLEPITGRSHQLRFELARHQQPIVSDTLYFAPVQPYFAPRVLKVEEEAAAGRIALCALELNFLKCKIKGEPIAPTVLPPTFALSLNPRDLFSWLQPDWAT